MVWNECKYLNLIYIPKLNVAFNFKPNSQVAFKPNFSELYWL